MRRSIKRASRRVAAPDLASQRWPLGNQNDSVRRMLSRMRIDTASENAI